MWIEHKMESDTLNVRILELIAKRLISKVGIIACEIFLTFDDSIFYKETSRWDLKNLYNFRIQ